MYLMKKRFLITCCILLLLLSVCSVPSLASAEQTAVAPQEALQAYENVLLGNHRYLQCDPYDDLITEASMTEKISSWYGFTFDPPLMFLSFSVTDLDDDAYPELLLQLSGDFGYELLRYDAGAVYGYAFVARAMEAVTQEGEIHASNGANNFGWYRIRFSGEAMQTVVVCWQDDEEPDNFRYLLGDTECTQSEFEEMNESLWNKGSLLWTEYSPEAVSAAVEDF